MFNFPTDVLQRRKDQYQEGNEVDCKLLCSNGFVTGGYVVLAGKSHFFDQAITKGRKEQKGENVGKPVELDFKLHSKEAVKMFLDLVYEVNTTPITAKMGVQIMIFLSQLGRYKTKEGKDDYPGTTKMIDALAEEMKKIIPALTVDEKVDLSISLMVIPIKPALELAKLCLQDVSSTKFEKSYINLIENFFKQFETQNPFIDEENFAIGIIAIYLRGVIKNRPLTRIDFQEKLQQIFVFVIAEHLTADLASSPGLTHTWSEIALHNCGKTGRFGPNLETCIESYQTEWSKDKRLFNVESTRPGIQILTIPRDGLYSFDVFGAGNYRHMAAKGARIGGEVHLKMGDILHIAIGQKGTNYFAGSGGTFIVKRLSDGSYEKLFIAGGAGGHVYWPLECCNASLDQFGNGQRERNMEIGSSGSGDGTPSNGGAGYEKNAPDATENSPKCFADGLQGGLRNVYIEDNGGFGGGGRANYGAGGGGYTGGNGSTVTSTSEYSRKCGGGGGSYNIDPNGTAELGSYDNGKCTIKYLGNN